MQKVVKVGPVDSKFPDFDIELRDYLTRQDFIMDKNERTWKKEFPSAVTADVAQDNLTKELERLIEKYGPILPRIFQV